MDRVGGGGGPPIMRVRLFMRRNREMLRARLLTGTFHRKTATSVYHRDHTLSYNEARGCNRLNRASRRRVADSPGDG